MRVTSASASEASTVLGATMANSSPPRRTTGVGVAHAGQQALGDRAQHLVPGGMAECVVDGLEPVQVQQQNMTLQ